MYHLKREAKKNLSGLKSFYFIESSKIIRDPRPNEIRGQSLLIEELPLEAGANWFQGIVTKFTLSYEQEKRENRSGEYFEQRIRGVMARISPELSEILRYFDRRKFVLATLDFNGYLRLVGSKASPLTFSYTDTSGSSPRDRNGLSFTFEGQTRRASLFIITEIYPYFTEQLQPDHGAVSIRTLDDGVTFRTLDDGETFRILDTV